MSRHAGLRPAPQFTRRHHPDFDRMATQGWKALEAEGKLPATAWRRERQWAARHGPARRRKHHGQGHPDLLRAASFRTSRASTPFMKAPYIENVRDVGKYDAAVSGYPSIPAPPTAPARGLGRRAFGGFRRSFQIGRIVEDIAASHSVICSTQIDPEFP